jgi:4-amino-4-deoxy-L-arabinose transferase-like glycosyltransferase
VLEVAREMRHTKFDGWMIPHSNGVRRLHQPPLAYWLSAASFHLFGVSAGSGRVPTAILGWLCVGLTFWIGKWLFDRRAGFFGAAAVLSSFLLLKYFRLAETDPLSCVFTTAATFFFWRAIEQGRDTSADADKRPSRRKEYIWYHAAAAALGLALMSKGPQIAFPLLFFVCYAGLLRQWGALGRFVLCGAPITFAVFGLPWWIYVFVTQGAARWRTEIEVSIEGEDHAAWFYIYIPYILYDIVPWCAFVVAGLVESARHLRRDWRHLGLAVWSLTIIVPLCFNGNKQTHYLLPLMPPLLIVAGWLVSEAWRRRDEGFHRAMHWILLGTILVCLLTPAGVFIGAHLKLHQFRAIDWVTASVLLVTSVISLVVLLRRGLRAGLLTYTFAAVISMIVVVGWWMPSLDEQGWETMEGTFKHVGDRPVVFYSRSPNLRLSFAMRRVVPVIDDPAALRVYLNEKPDTLVVVLKVGHHAGLQAPDFLVEEKMLATDDEVLGLYHDAPR